MKRILFIALVICLSFASIIQAQEATLSPAVALSPTTAAKIQIRHIDIRPLNQEMVITYRWLDADNKPLYPANQYGTYDATWSFRNDLGEPVANCTEPDKPYDCCTGPGAGTGCRAADMAFNGVFGFTIRAQDVGKTLGRGVRDLIINKMKNDISALAGVSITFSD